MQGGFKGNALGDLDRSSHRLAVHSGWTGMIFGRQLPFPVALDKAEATFDNGMLTLRLPKAELARTKKISIKGSSGTRSTNQRRSTRKNSRR